MGLLFATSVRMPVEILPFLDSSLLDPSKMRRLADDENLRKISRLRKMLL